MQGWVQEMWGYSIAAASLGVKHRLVRNFQVERGAATPVLDPASDSSSPTLQVEYGASAGRIPPEFPTLSYIFHYTRGPPRPLRTQRPSPAPPKLPPPAGRREQVRDRVHAARPAAGRDADRRDLAETQPRRSRDAAETQPRCSRDVAAAGRDGSRLPPAHRGEDRAAT